MKKLFLFLFAMLFLLSCTKSNDANQLNELKEIPIDSLSQNETVSKGHEKNASKDPAKDWLQSLFQCKSGNKFCFYLETEKRATSKRFYEFMIDSEQIYGATNLTDEEMPLAKRKYKEKWSKIYPLRNEMEPWLFGRGQDDTEHIKAVKIEKIAALKYRVFVDYGDSYQTINQATLIKNNNSYLIDYCETEFIEAAEAY